MIETKNLTFSYGDTKVLLGIDLKVNKGEFLSVLGTNGSGKSTLLGLLSGHLSPIEGRILYDGENLADISFARRAKLFTLIGQGEKIHFPYTCLEVVLMGRNPLNNGRISHEDIAVALEMMEKTGTLPFEDKPVGQISGGEYQRVMLAKALSQKAGIFFLDEAFSSMDISYTLRCLTLMKELVKKEGATVVSVMHDINMAYLFSDRVCILHDTKIAVCGHPKHALTEETVGRYFHIRAELVGDSGFIIKGGLT